MMELQPIFFDAGLLLVTMAIFCLGLVMYFWGRQSPGLRQQHANVAIKLVSPVPAKIPSERDKLEQQICSFQAYLSGIDELLICVDDPEYRKKLRFEQFNTQDFLEQLQSELNTLPFTQRSKGAPLQ
jgi:hypothetical protein